MVSRGIEMEHRHKMGLIKQNFEQKNIIAKCNSDINFHFHIFEKKNFFLEKA